MILILKRCSVGLIGLFSMMSFQASVLAQSPAGISTPIYWYQADIDQAPQMVVLPENILQELQIFTVYESKSVAEELIWSLGSEDTAAIAMTNQRLAELDDLNYLSHEAGELGQSVFLHTFYRRKSEAFVGSPYATQLRIAHAHPYPRIPVEENSARLLELVAFDHVLTPNERQRLESYLALKHGLTIRQDDPRHYLDSEGQAYWNAEIGREFGRRVAGIGRDIDGSMYKTQGQSQLPQGQLIRINTGELTCDLCYLSWSDNGQATAMDLERNLEIKPLFRRWQIQMQQWPQTQEFQIQLDSRSLFSIPADMENWRLMVDVSGTGEFRENEIIYTPPHRVDEETAIITWNIERPTNATEVFHLSFGFNTPELDQSDDFWKSAILSPNPSPDGHFQVRVETAYPNSLIIHVFDNLGRLVSTIQSQESKYHLVEGYTDQPGTYRLELQAENHQKTLTLLIP